MDVLYREIHPGQRLSPFIRCFWILEGAEDQHSVERILPDGSPELVIHYGEPFEKWRKDLQNWETQQNVLLIGQATGSILLRPGRRIGVIGVRFRPYGAAPFFNQPMSEFTDQIVSASELSSYRDIAEKVSLAPDNAERIRILRSWLEQSLRTQADPLVTAVAQYIGEHPDPVAVRQLSGKFHTTERSLQRRFQRTIGLSPKQYAKIVRFQRVLNILQRRSHTSLTEIAQDSGYYDQSHFIHDFKTVAAITPSQYLRELHRLSDHFISN